MNSGKFNRKIGLAGSILLIVALVVYSPTSAAAESYQVLYPCLGDLSGFTAAPPQGMDMNQMGMKLVNATRTYTHGDKELTALITIGGSQMAAAAMMPQGMMDMETDEGRVSMKEIDGFQVHTGYDKQDHSGAVTVILFAGESGGAFFTLSFTGLSEKEGLKLARKFDWRQIKKKAAQFK